MWSRRITSGAAEYESAKDVIRILLRQLIEVGCETSWAHFEVVARRGYFLNLLWGNQPWVEVALLKDSFLGLNVCLRKSKLSGMPPVPGKWQASSNRNWVLPVADSEELLQWIDQCLSSASGNPEYKLTGWREG